MLLNACDMFPQSISACSLRLKYTLYVFCFSSVSSFAKLHWLDIPVFKDFKSFFNVLLICCAVFLNCSAFADQP